MCLDTKLNFDDLNCDLNSHINPILEKIVIQREQEINNFLLGELHKVKPQIKGEITENKLKWRGVKIVENHSEIESSYWLEQRGVVISDIITINNKISFS